MQESKMNDEIIFDENEDWETRILCSDEACIGVVSADGRCKECGRVYEGALPEERCAAQGQDTHTEKALPAEEEITDSDDEWEKRVLCGDEACIGVIGEDGRCMECGKPL
jgi:hypothetical protein